MTNKTFKFVLTNYDGESLLKIKLPTDKKNMKGCDIKIKWSNGSIIQASINEDYELLVSIPCIDFEELEHLSFCLDPKFIAYKIVEKVCYNFLIEIGEHFSFSLLK